LIIGIKKSKQVNIFKKIKLRNIKGDVFFLADKYSERKIKTAVMKARKKSIIRVSFKETDLNFEI
tara:strand:- start:989 stop:1183 length:195 start_codon:yes stop_codon:yes gene_type:complete